MPTTLEREHQLQGEIAPRVEHDVPGVDVLAVELLTPSRFRVYVDHPEGVDHALCERVTDVLRDYLREYSVEVSSPGLDRPLRRQEHFEAAIARWAPEADWLTLSVPWFGMSPVEQDAAAHRMLDRLEAARRPPGNNS